MSRQYYIYILECSDGSYYTGMCNNMERRLQEHETGFDPYCYTYKRRPIKLAFVEIFTDVNQLIEREKQIKGWSHAKKKALIERNWNKLVGLSKNFTEFGHPSTALRQAQGDSIYAKHPRA